MLILIRKKTTFIVKKFVQIILLVNKLTLNRSCNYENNYNRCINKDSTNNNDITKTSDSSTISDNKNNYNYSDNNITTNNHGSIIKCNFNN
jgi:hypothetical protein